MAKREFSLLTKVFMVIEAGLILPLVYGTSFLPFPVIFRFSKAVGSLILRFSPSKLAEVQENLTVITPERRYTSHELHSIAAESQGFILRIFIELQKISRMGIQDTLACFTLMESSVYARMLRLRKENTPQVFLTAHMGNWELSGIAMHLLGFDMLSVVERQFNPFLDAYYQRLRRKAGISIIYNEISLMRPLLKGMRSGRCTALVADQNYWHDPIFLPFFGKEASAPKGVGSLIVQTQAQAVIGASLRKKDGRYNITARNYPIPPSTGSKDEDILRLTAGAYRFYEEIISRNPADWFLLSTARWRLTKESWKEWAKNPDSSQF